MSKYFSDFAQCEEKNVIIYIQSKDLNSYLHIWRYQNINGINNPSITQPSCITIHHKSQQEFVDPNYQVWELYNETQVDITVIQFENSFEMKYM